MFKFFITAFFSIIFTFSPQEGFSYDASTLYAATATNSSKRGKSVRNFRPPTAKEKEDISYIINTLSQKSLIRLLSYKPSLEKAGDRIRKVHPLRFLEYAFSDEKLKAGVHAIRKRGWVWSDFFGGLKESLQDEAENNNMTYDQICVFCASVGLKPEAVLTSIENKRWSELFEILLKKIPRSTKTKRYGM